MQRAYLDLVGARWLVFDKGDPASRAPGLQAQLAAYRKIYPLDREDGDFAVFRVPHARAYLSGWPRAALAYGDARVMPELALSLAHDGYLLVSADGGRPSVPVAFDAVYLSEPAPAPPPEIDARAIAIAPDATSVALPPRIPREDALDGATVARPSDDRIDARFTASRACVAVFGESDYPFWRASLDGRPAPILRVAYGLMGIAVTPGPHAVALRYEPPRSYAWSAMASAASFVAMAIAALVAALRARGAA